MRIRTAVLLLLALTARVDAQTAPQFQVDVVAVDSSALPGLHSFSAAPGKNGRWLIVGGRTNGLHLFVASSNGGTTPPPNAFPTTNANQKLWVIEPAARKAWSAPLSSLAAPISDALSANNAEHYAADGYLYVIGGYGWSTQFSQMITFPTLTAIAVDDTIAAIVSGKPFAPYVQQTSTYYDCIAYGQNAYGACFRPYNMCPGGPPCPCPSGPDYQSCVQKGAQSCLAAQHQAVVNCNGSVRKTVFAGIPTNSGAYTKVTGGGMEKIGDSYYLVFGQDFEGLYSVSEGDYGKWPVNQIYTERVVALWIQPRPLTAAVLQQVQQDQSEPTRQFHRRDLNVVPALGPDGTTQLIQALGGVFVPGTDSAYQLPILISAPSAPDVSAVVGSFRQRMSQYDCAVVPLFDRTPGVNAMTNLLLGGISLHYVDEKTGKLKVDSGLPFISALTALTLRRDGTWQEFYRAAPITIDGQIARVGSDAGFFRNPKVAAAPNGVIYLDLIKTKTLAGWMYGGITAEGPHPGGSNKGSAASSQLFEIWIDPTAPAAGYWANTGN